MLIAEAEDKSKWKQTEKKKEKRIIHFSVLLVLFVLRKYRTNLNLSITLNLYILPRENEIIYFSQSYQKNQFKKKKRKKNQKKSSRLWLWQVNETGLPTAGKPGGGDVCYQSRVALCSCNLAPKGKFHVRLPKVIQPTGAFCSFYK